MGTRIKTLAILLVGYVVFFGTLTAQAQTSPVHATSLHETLYRTVCEQVPEPLVFSTRDTLFALSLPEDEPAEIYLQLTVGKNGKVKDKQTKVHANHIATGVAPFFIAATAKLRVDRSLLNRMAGRDTSLTLAFPLEYQCVYDTINKAWPSEDISPLPFYYMKTDRGGYRPIPMTSEERVKYLENRWPILTYSGRQIRYRYAPLTRVWYYVAFIKE